MQGRRTHDIVIDDYYGWDALNAQPGDYFKLFDKGMWGFVAPNGDGGVSGTHTIIEHDDMTITVSPSLQFETGKRWHGYLEKGVWREC